LDWLYRDLRVAIRLLRHDRGFALTALVTLALCIGANSALFSVVHHLLLRPLPVPESERILLMANQYPKAGAGAAESRNSGVPDYYDRLRETDVYEEQALFNRSSLSFGQDGLPSRVRVMNATPSYFRVMRVPPALGRPFSEEEGEPGNERKVVLSESFWRSQLGGDPAVVGKDLRLDGQPYTVLGVMPRSFEALSPGVLLWRPLAFTAEQKSDSNRHSNNYWNVGRLKPGATLARAQAQVDALNAANLERFPQYKELLLNAGFHTSVARLQDVLVREVKPTLSLLWGGALFVLLIGCVNVANLSLVRARARFKELATRLALGAGRAQLSRQLVIESLVLTLAAAGAGLLLGASALRLLGALDLQELPHASEIRLDGVAVSYTLLLSLAIGAALGLLPAAAALPANLAQVLREEGRGTSSARGARSLRRALVVGQVGFTFVLLLGAGLLFASLRKVLQVDPGFVPEQVFTASVTLPRTRYADEAAVRAFSGEALRRVRALPGVVAGGATDTIPFGGSSNDSVIFAEGYQMQPGESVISPNRVNVTPGYFEAMGVRLLEGRFFQEGDDGALSVVIVDRRLAQHFWPGQSPLGRRMYQPTDINDLLAVTKETVFHTVVGVIEDLTLHDLTEGAKTVGTYYFPMAQDGSRLVTFAVKSAGQPESVAASLRQAVAALDGELPVYDSRTMEERLDKALLNRRSPALLALGFGMVALLLSTVGIYGVLAYLVSQRRKEIGIRLALGSSARAIFELVLREGVLLVGAGLVTGALGALALRRSLEALLFGVRATDPLVIGGVTALLALAALLACSLPARRATRIDPRLALSE
jgi:predicted permease